MRRSYLVALLAMVCVAAVAGATGLAVGQSGGLAPNILNINQSVPMVVTMTGANGQPQAVPLTVTVALQVRVDGRQISAVALAPTAAASSPAAVQRDNRGMSYRLDIAAPFVVSQVQSEVNVFDKLDVFGEVRNGGTTTKQFVQIVVTYYKDGRIVGTESGFANLEQLSPGQTTSFRVQSMRVGKDANAYTIQVQSMMN